MFHVALLAENYQSQQIAFATALGDHPLGEIEQQSGIRTCGNASACNGCDRDATDITFSFGSPGVSLGDSFFVKNEKSFRMRLFLAKIVGAAMARRRSPKRCCTHHSQASRAAVLAGAASR